MTPQVQIIDREDERRAATYHRFMVAVKWFGLHCAVLGVFFTLWFATSAGFWAGLIAALVVLAAGVYAMTHGMAHSSEAGDFEDAVQR